MSLVTKSASTRKETATVETRIQKRREKFPLVAASLAPIPSAPVDEIGGTASLVESSTRGGYFVEYLTTDGYAHAVPIECLDALGYADPVAPKAPASTTPKAPGN